VTNGINYGVDIATGKREMSWETAGSFLLDTGVDFAIGATIGKLTGGAKYDGPLKDGLKNLTADFTKKQIAGMFGSTLGRELLTSFRDEAFALIFKGFLSCPGSTHINPVTPNQVISGACATP
jgi:hypothetical protein